MITRKPHPLIAVLTATMLLLSAVLLFGRAPTVASLLLAGKLLKRGDRAEEAVEVLRQAKDILDWQPEGKEQPCSPTSF